MINRQLLPAAAFDCQGGPSDRALARLQEPDTTVRRYRAPDSLLEFLKTL